MNIYTRYSIMASIASMSFYHLPMANAETGGVIHFSGAIVEDSCTIDNTDQDINIGCYRDGKDINIVLPISDSKSSFPQGEVHPVKWLNDSETLGLLKITYN